LLSEINEYFEPKVYNIFLNEKGKEEIQ